MKVVAGTDGNATKAVCKAGPYKDCDCTGPALAHIYIPTPSKVKLLRTLRELRGGNSTSKPTCPIVMTDIPSNVFSSSQSNIHNHFCTRWLKNAAQMMTVDSMGENAHFEPHLKTVKRTPPANPGSYADFRFDLAFEPSGNGANCRVDCNKAFEEMGASCRGSSPGVYMYEKGTYNVGCGKFLYAIRKAGPDEPRIRDEVADLIPYDRYCYKPEELPELKGDIHDGDVRYGTGWACAGRALPEYAIRKDNKTSFAQTIQRYGSVPYQ